MTALLDIRRLAHALWLTALVVVVAASLAPAAVAAHVPLAAAHLSDKDAHFLGYVLLAFFPVLACRRTLLGVLFASAAIPLGVALEFAQRLIPGRSFEPRDMLANTLGVCAGLALAALLRSSR